MKRGILYLVGLCALVVAYGLLSLARFDAPNRSDFYVGGIMVNEPDHRQWVSTLKSTGMNTVSVTVYAMQGDWDSDNLWYQPEEPYVINEIKTAKAAGLNVVLILRVALDHAYEPNEFMWHGMIAPKDDATLDSWFTKYERFVLKWATIAEELGVDVLGIGSEMNALSATVPVKGLPGLEEWYLNEDKQQHYRDRILKFEDRIKSDHLWVRGHDNYADLKTYLEAKSGKFKMWAERTAYVDKRPDIDAINARRAKQLAHWQRIINSTRNAYHGKLTYAANFDNFEEVGFWKDLDQIGINAYFPLREPGDEQAYANAPTDYMTDRWAIVLDNIELFREMNGVQDKPVMFTELGYTYRHYSTLEPWGGYGFSVVGDTDKEQLMVWNEQRIDHEERKLAVRALYQAHRDRKPVINGILYWKLTTDKSHLDGEPFALHIGPGSDDGLQQELARFAE